MTRHGIVVPLPGLSPPPECKGGPAFCAGCNAEMLEVESRAMRMAANEEKRYGYTGVLFEALWKSRGYKRAHFRKLALRLIVLRDRNPPAPPRIRPPPLDPEVLKIRRREKNRARMKKRNGDPAYLAKKRERYRQRTAEQKIRDAERYRERYEATRHLNHVRYERRKELAARRLDNGSYFPPV